MLKDNTITAQKVTQNNQEYFIGVFTISQVLKFTKYTERLIVGYDEVNKPIYNPEIQRKVETSRVDKIADFLMYDPDALFPTNLVISIPSSVIERITPHQNDRIVDIELSDTVFQEIKKVNGDVFLTIIDGQHRVRGIEKAIASLYLDIDNYNKILADSNNPDIQKKLFKASSLVNNLLNIELIVSFFIDPTLEFQAMVFSTINRTQKSVPQSLVYSLFGLTASDSPQKTALETVLALNSSSISPFYNRIRLHGGKYGSNQSPPLTQAMMVKSVIDLISSSAREAEKDRFKERKELLININRDLPFRRYYANNNDQIITDILFSFFTAVKNCFVKDQKSLWEFEKSTSPSNILQTTVGFQALLDILIDILVELDEDLKDKIQTYEGYLNKAKELAFFDLQRYPFTSKSRSIFYYDLSLKIWPQNANNDERIAELNRLLRL